MVVDLPRKPGFYERFLEDSGERFALYLPDRYETANANPLVLVLHWGGPAQPRRGEAILSTLALPGLGSLNAILVAPDCPDEHWITERSEGFILDLLDLLQREYKLDSRRCLITGYSMGAIGTWYMASRHQERFSAAILISGTPPRFVTETAWRIPLYVIHSVHDEHFPLKDTHEMVDQLMANGVDIEWMVVEGVTHFDVAGFIGPLRDAITWIHQVWDS